MPLSIVVNLNWVEQGSNPNRDSLLLIHIVFGGDLDVGVPEEATGGVNVALVAHDTTCFLSESVERLRAIDSVRR
jgi:hypothetical protein